MQGVLQNCPGEVMLWTNHRVMEWLRSIDLSEYAPNLRGSGVHGALMVCNLLFIFRCHTHRWQLEILGWSHVIVSLRQTTVKKWIIRLLWFSQACWLKLTLPFNIELCLCVLKAVNASAVELTNCHAFNQIDFNPPGPTVEAGTNSSALEDRRACLDLSVRSQWNPDVVL